MKVGINRFFGNVLCTYKKSYVQTLMASHYRHMEGNTPNSEGRQISSSDLFCAKIIALAVVCNFRT